MTKATTEPRNNDDVQISPDTTLDLIMGEGPGQRCDSYEETYPGSNLGQLRGLRITDLKFTNAFTLTPAI